MFQLRTLFLALSHSLEISQNSDLDCIETIVSEVRDALRKDSKFLMDSDDIAFLNSL